MAGYDNNFWETLLTPVWKLVRATAPGSKTTQLRMLAKIKNDFFDPTFRHKQNRKLSPIQRMEADLVLLGKSHIERHCENLKHSNSTECSPALQLWPNLSERNLSRLTLWLMKDPHLSTGLVVEHSLDLAPGIIDHVTEWGDDRIHLLKKARDEFKQLYKFLRVFTKDGLMPRNLISALLDESPVVPSNEEILLMRTDLHYCENLINAIVH